MSPTECCTARRLAESPLADGIFTVSIFEIFWRFHEFPMKITGTLSRTVAVRPRKGFGHYWMGIREIRLRCRFRVILAT